MSKSHLPKILFCGVCVIGIKIIFNKISNYYESTTIKVSSSETSEKFDLNSEIASLREKTPRDIESLLNLSKVQSGIDSFMNKAEGQIVPHYFYKITKGENSCYLLGTNHGISSVVFNLNIYQYLDASTIYVTEAEVYTPESEALSEEEVVYDTAAHIILLPDWHTQLSKYCQKFVELAYKETNVLVDNSVSPQDVYNFLMREIYKITTHNAMDLLLAKYFSVEKKGKLAFFENQEDRDNAELLLHDKPISTESEPSEQILTEQDLYYINKIDKIVTDLVDGYNYCYPLQLLRKILGKNSFSYDAIESIAKYLIGNVDLDQDPATDQRTLNCLPKIKQLLDNNSEVAFIAVGVQHIICENGIVKHFEVNVEYNVSHLGLSDAVN